MNTLKISKSIIKFLFLLLIPFIIFSYTGCEGFDIPDGAEMVQPEDPDEPDSGEYGILYIDSCNTEIGPFNGQINYKLISLKDSHTIQYYEVEESYSADFSGTINLIISKQGIFKTAPPSSIVKYYRARAVFNDEAGGWSNIINVKKSSR